MGNDFYQMIKVRLSGRLCNWLHMYAYARILAEDSGSKFTFWSKNIRKSKIGHIIAKYFPNICDIEGNNYNKTTIKIKRHGYHIPVKELVNLIKTKEASVTTNGCFEFHSLYSKEQQKRIRKFMDCRQTLKKNDLSKLDLYYYKKGLIKTHIRDLTPDDVVIHFRTGDLLAEERINRFLDFNYYEQILSILKFNRLFIVTEKNTFEKENFYLIAPFLKYNPIFCSNDMMTDFNFIRLFDTIIMSQSSFSFWAQLLSNATKIYVPVTLLGHWNKSNEYLRCNTEAKYVRVYEEPIGCLNKYVTHVSQLRKKLKIMRVLNAKLEKQNKQARQISNQNKGEE